MFLLSWVCSEIKILEWFLQFWTRQHFLNQSLCLIRGGLTKDFLSPAGQSVCRNWLDMVNTLTNKNQQFNDIISRMKAMNTI